MTLVQTPRAIVTTVATSGLLTAGAHNPVDATAGSLTMTLPTPADAGAHLSVEKVDSSVNTVTVSGSIRGAITTTALSWQNESTTYVWSGSTWWPTEGLKTKASIDAAINAAVSGAVSAKDSRFVGGAKGDGTTDDTAALQAFITYCVVNGRAGYIPGGVYKITSQLNFPYRPGWSIRGDGPNSTRIVQYTSNVPIFNLGSDTASFMHTYIVERMTLDYATSQSGQSSASHVLFSQMAYEGVWRDIVFVGGFDAMRVAAGIGCPWGTTFDNLQFSGQYGSAMDWSVGVNGVPNNRFGRIVVSMGSMTKTAMQIRGYNFRIDTVEFLSNNNGLGLMDFAAGSNPDIGTVKVEVGTYTANTTLIRFQTNSLGRINQFVFAGSTPTVNSLPSGSNLTILALQGGTGGILSRVYIDSVISGTFSSTPGAGGAYVCSVGASAFLEIGHVQIATGWTLTNMGSSGSAQQVRVNSWLPGTATTDKGDGNVTVTRGDPNIIVLNTALTAPRTVTLPADGSMFSGLYYDVIVNGAVNGTNTVTVVSGATTVATLATDKTRARFVWRRSNPSNPAAGWFLAEYNTLP